MLVCAPDGTVLYWNRAAETLFGWSASQIVGRKIDETAVAPKRPAEAGGSECGFSSASVLGTGRAACRCAATALLRAAAPIVSPPCGVSSKARSTAIEPAFTVFALAYMHRAYIMSRCTIIAPITLLALWPWYCPIRCCAGSRPRLPSLDRLLRRSLLRHEPGMSIELPRRALAPSHPGAVRLVNRLAAPGLIERRPSAGDRRAVALHRTPAGEHSCTATLSARFDRRD
ncbi:PAS domain-containing protein [Hansschlegelia sp. KR7-227]|uniref:PAS domain-containing protein n=1 Tax=Hansschlegelia sp. KR7-227 TaxID=3400914 RepID=UPI003C0B8E00